MILAISEIKKKPEGVDFSGTLDIKDEVIRRNPEVLDLKNVSVVGNVSYDNGLYILTYKLDYTITLPSSRSMIPVDIFQEDAITEVFVEVSELDTKKELVEESLALLLEGDSIDVVESVIDNILLSIPMRVLTQEELSSDQLPSGNNWSVLTENQYNALQNEKRQENNPFADLNGLFEDK